MQRLLLISRSAALKTLAERLTKEGTAHAAVAESFREAPAAPPGGLDCMAADLTTLSADDIPENLPQAGRVIWLTSEGTEALTADFSERFAGITPSPVTLHLPLRLYDLTEALLRPAFPRSAEDRFTTHERVVLETLKAAGPAGISACELADKIWKSSDIYALARLRQTLYRIRRKDDAPDILYDAEAKHYRLASPSEA